MWLSPRCANTVTFACWGGRAFNSDAFWEGCMEEGTCCGWILRNAFFESLYWYISLLDILMISQPGQEKNMTQTNCCYNWGMGVDIHHFDFKIWDFLSPFRFKVSFSQNCHGGKEQSHTLAVQLRRNSYGKRLATFLFFFIKFISKYFLLTRFSSLNLNPLIFREFKKWRDWCSSKDVSGEFAAKAQLI